MSARGLIKQQRNQRALSSITAVDLQGDTLTVTTSDKDVRCNLQSAIVGVLGTHIPGFTMDAVQGHGNGQSVYTIPPQFSDDIRQLDVPAMLMSGVSVVHHYAARG